MNLTDSTIGKPLEIITTCECKYSNYDIVNGKDGDLYIIASDNRTSNITRDMRYRAECSSSEMLYELLEMYSQLGIKSSTRKDILLELNEKHFNPILQISHKYGLFFCGENYYNEHDIDITNNIPENVLSELKKKYNYKDICWCACSLSAFLYWTKILYRDFLNLITIYSPQKLEQFNGIFKVKNIQKKIEKKSKLKEHWQPSIAIAFDSILHRSQDGFYFQIDTNSLFHACLYYFSLLCVGASSSDNYIDKTMHVKQCKLCKANFLTAQSRKRYCPYCSPQKAWNKKNR